MTKSTDRTVYKRADGKWVNKRDAASRPAGVHATQTEAAQEGRGMLRNRVGGELTIQGVDGRIRSKDAISPGNGPNAPRDSEH